MDSDYFFDLNLTVVQCSLVGFYGRDVPITLITDVPNFIFCESTAVPDVKIHKMVLLGSTTCPTYLSIYAHRHLFNYSYSLNY